MNQSQNILVVGGASGIGKDFVIDRAKKGDNVFFTDLNKSAGEQLQQKLRNDGCQVFYFQHDVTSWENTVEVVGNMVNQAGSIDVLVHSAGITNIIKWEDLTYQEWKKTFQINLTGLFYTLKSVLPYMLDHNGGDIVIVGSGSSITGSGGGVHYASSKGGAIGLMRAIAKKYSSEGIHINLVAPRVIETPMLHLLYPTEESLDELIHKIPVRKIGQMEDTTGAINFLISEASSYIQSKVLLVDGGRTYLSN